MSDFLNFKPELGTGSGTDQAPDLESQGREPERISPSDIVLMRESGNGELEEVPTILLQFEGQTNKGDTIQIALQWRSRDGVSIQDLKIIPKLLVARSLPQGRGKIIQ